MPFLAAFGTSQGWQGYGNGMVPASKLCRTADGYKLRCDAAAAYGSLADAYKAQFGKELCITDFGTPQYQWMEAHAGAYGWVHPDWASQGGDREEPWHWEFRHPATT
jgi:hypothetical protein